MTKLTEQEKKKMRDTLSEHYQRAGRSGEETLDNRIKALMIHGNYSPDDALVALYQGHKAFQALKPT